MMNTGFAGAMQGKNGMANVLSNFYQLQLQKCGGSAGRRGARADSVVCWGRRVL